jgi:predicted ArsR family transcriptional regulator
MDGRTRPVYIVLVSRADLDLDIGAIASLNDPTRRGLYRYVARRRGDVGRDDAARALRISRALAAFHLDKLAEQGLLEVSYRRLTRRSGPGAGRPAKLYRRSSRQVDLTLPQRRYQLAGRVLAHALQLTARLGRRALAGAARAEGRRLGAEARRRAGRAAGPERRLAAALTLLDECGYEPARSHGDVLLRNCPFAALANDCQLVCGMNAALVRGMLAAAGARGVRAEFRLDPASCCVILRGPTHPRR